MSYYMTDMTFQGTTVYYIYKEFQNHRLKPQTT